MWGDLPQLSCRSALFRVDLRYIAAARGVFLFPSVSLSQSRAMVSQLDLMKRHAVYAIAIVLIITMSKYTWLLAVTLTGVLLGIRWHHSTPVPFMLLTSFATPIATGFCVKLSAHTWWYASPIDFIGVPPWLFPLHGLLAHWVLDAYFMVTLRDLRKSALPGADH